MSNNPGQIGSRHERELVPTLLSPENLQVAINLAKEIFPDPHDLEYLKRSLARAAEQEPVYLSPGAKREIRQLPHFIYSVDETAVGFGGIAQYQDEPKSSWLSWLGVSKDFRGQGLGRQIINHLAKLSRLLGFKEVAVICESDPNSSPHRFYQANHFNLAEECLFNEERCRVLRRSL